MKRRDGMGAWWKTVKDQPAINVGYVSFGGDTSAMSKVVPLLWRKNQDWHSLQVGALADGEFNAGYYLYFKAPETGLRMRYRRVLTSRFVMVREGPEPVLFWVTDLKGVSGDLLRTGVMVPGNRYRRDMTKQGASFAAQTIVGTHTWV